MNPFIFTSVTSVYIGITLWVSKYLQQQLIGGPFLGSYIEAAELSNLILYSVIKIALAILYLFLVKTTKLNVFVIVLSALFVRSLGGPFMFTLIGTCFVEKYIIKRPSVTSQIK